MYNVALPDGWISVVHESGGKLYLHRDTRVCTWSKPYYVSTSRTIKVDNAMIFIVVYLFYRIVRKF